MVARPLPCPGRQRDSFRWQPTLHLRLLSGVVLAATIAACTSGGPTRDMPAEAAAGQRVFQRLGCNACHSFENRVMPGPALLNIYDKPVRLLDGTTVVRDDAYLERSILDPAAQVVEGYRPTMIGYGPMLQEGELEQLLALIRFHSDKPH